LIHPRLDPNSSFIGELGADSLDDVEGKLAFEEALDLPIPQDEADRLNTIQDVVHYIGKLKASV
jgi:acyl carrier protein